MPCPAHLQIYDNSVEVGMGEAVPDPVLVADMASGQLAWPVDLDSLRKTPDWAKPLVEAALSMRG